MKNLYAVLAILLVLGALFASQGTPAVVADDVPKILEFDSMAGVSRPYTGAANAIRGVPGGGLVPWTAIFGALKQVGFDGYVLLEAYNSGIGDFAYERGMFHNVCPDAASFVREGLAFVRAGLAS